MSACVCMYVFDVCNIMQCKNACMSVDAYVHVHTYVCIRMFEQTKRTYFVRKASDKAAAAMRSCTTNLISPPASLLRPSASPWYGKRNVKRFSDGHVHTPKA